MGDRISARTLQELDFSPSPDSVDGWTLLKLKALGNGPHGTTEYRLTLQDSDGVTWTQVACFHEEGGWFCDGFNAAGQPVAFSEIEDLAEVPLNRKKAK